MTRRTNSVPRDPVVRHLAVCEVTRETLRAVMETAPDSAIMGSLCIGLLERLETSENELRQAVEGKSDVPAPVKRGRPRKAADNGDGPAKSADNGDGPAKSAGIPMGSVTGGLDKDGIPLDETN